MMRSQRETCWDPKNMPRIEWSPRQCGNSFRVGKLTIHSSFKNASWLSLKKNSCYHLLETGQNALGEHSSAGNIHVSVGSSPVLKWIKPSCQVLSALEKLLFDKGLIARDFDLREPIDFSSFIFKFTLMFYRRHHCLTLLIKKERELQGKACVFLKMKCGSLILISLGALGWQLAIMTILTSDFFFFNGILTFCGEQSLIVHYLNDSHSTPIRQVLYYLLSYPGGN